MQNKPPKNMKTEIIPNPFITRLEISNVKQFLFFFSEIELITHEIAAIEKTIEKIIR